MGEVADETVELDLFGDPVFNRCAKRGRPEHVATARNRQKVDLLFAVGYDVKEVAQAMGISQPTLRKHYFSSVEKRDSADRRVEAELLVELIGQVKDGKTGAATELFKRLDRGRLDKMAARHRAPEPKAAKKGKKEEAQEKAAAVAGVFSAPEPPSQLLQ